MTKRKPMRLLITVGIAITMLFAVVGLSACEIGGNPTIEEYQATAITVLETYADGKGQSNYTEANWALLQSHVESGRTAINEAETKPTVRTARDNAKADIRAVSRENDISLTGVFTAYRDAELPVSGKVQMTAVILGNQISISFGGGRIDVFEFSQVGDYFNGQNGRTAISFVIDVDALFIRLGDADAIKFNRDTSIYSISDNHVKLDSPKNISYGSSGLSWNINADNIAGFLGVSVEIRRTGTDEFAILPPRDRIMSDSFAINFVDLGLVQGTNILRISHIGGPYFWNAEISKSITSEPTYIILTKNYNGNISVQIEELN